MEDHPRGPRGSGRSPADSHRLLLHVRSVDVLNPYAPSKTQSSLNSRPQMLPTSTFLGLCIGGLLLFGVLALAAYILYLYVRYPGLTDPPARPVDYWPEIEVLVSAIAIGIGLLIGLPVFLTSFSIWRRLRVQSCANVNHQSNQKGDEPSVTTEGMG